ncbi:hypothetical protein BV20DRAFT_811943 [Pilatotrama ljubarskyi]|nr:hypothetical protein BV20DRAFT_811943 [Pilatotrama ljubarskyi]
MSTRYHPSTQYASPANAGTGQDAARVDLGRHDRDRDGSLSDSETSTSFNAYADNTKDDPHLHDSDDPYLALTSQTLNADGTPKRPMNAFMIFARKRRPQISAANQMMRTGDVSKILSKEWNSMDMSEKKFYLDQAKKLKDNFNSKYPDYVYRRRPNNSRKKRKPEAAHDDAHDPAHLGDPDDPAYEDTSPIDPDDTLMIPSPQELQYTRSHALSASPVYHTHDNVGPPPPPPPACTYPYSSDFHAAHSLSSSRLSHLAPEPALPGSTVGAVRPSSSMHDLNGLSQGYPSSQSLYQNHPAHHHHHPPHMYGAQSQHSPPGGIWDPTGSRGAGPRSEHPRSNWPVLPALDISLARQRASYQPQPQPSATTNPNGPGPIANGKSDGGAAGPYSPQLPHRPWSSATSSTASSSSGASASQHYGSSAFPTLSSAFFPADSPGSGTKGIDVSSPASSSSHDYYSPAGASMQGGGRRGSTGPGQEHAYTQGSGSQYGSGGGGQQNAAQAWTQHFSRAGGSGQQQQQQRVSGLHPISAYSLQASPGGGGEGSSRSASGSSAHSAAHLSFWDDRFGGR